MQITSAKPRVVAVLGPTNTGKTHLAMERMLGHDSGMIGFPLRLLARENYDRAVRIRGAGQVALITGEEKIVPPHARYFLCTVESMPLERSVSFLGVDEIQMCADPDRGHIFTDRLLYARGGSETMFMGAETIKPMIRRLVPGTEFMTRPRFSTLRFIGSHKITRLPPRSAVVAFSAADVYAIAELVRRHRGGAAVVLGALSPRTRNAQVAMYQAGEVDYLVATDAIGMGLNMDVDHVAFAQTRKFDGRVPRDLTPAEMAQIAGRAGRHMNDGTFGTTTDVAPFDPEVIARIENHDFEVLRALYWRNARLRFTSLSALRASLGQPSTEPGLVRARAADDELALETLAKDPAIAALATTPAAVALLWHVCQVPDFGKVLSDAHTRLLGRIYTFLMTKDGRLPEDWIATQVERVDRTDGDIDTLAQRIANVRTWTYVSFQAQWLDDASGWQERTRAVEDRLSDALHERLTQRFVDRRTAVLVRRMKDSAEMTAAVTRKGDVVVEGQFVGRLAGFRFAADAEETDPNARRAVTSAALRALRGETDRRVAGLEGEADAAFALDPATARILWLGEPVARLTAGADILAPAVEPLASDLLEGGQRERIRARLKTWLEDHVETGLGALMKVRRAELPGPARGLVYQVCEALGSASRHALEPQIRALDAASRRTLRRLGLRLGRVGVFLPALLRPAAVELRAVLWTVHAGLDAPPAAVPPGRVSVPMEATAPAAFYRAIGYWPAGPLAVRIDMLERVAEQAWTRLGEGPFQPGPDMLALAGCSPEDMAALLGTLGFRRRQKDGQDWFWAPVRKRRPVAEAEPHAAGRRRPKADDSPFAGLRNLVQPR
jgi:ATP-dependent RNA helicase SUPV3L1/SUV3